MHTNSPWLHSVLIVLTVVLMSHVLSRHEDTR
jgi:hypothetical protein